MADQRTWDELARATAESERARQRRQEREARLDRRKVTVTMTRGEARAAAIGLMVLGAHQDDGEAPEMYAAYCALRDAGGITSGGGRRGR